LLEEGVQICEDGEQRWQRVRFVEVGAGSAFIQEGNAEIEIGEGRCGEGFYKDVDHNIWVVEVRVELVARKKENKSSTWGDNWDAGKHTVLR